MCFRNLFRSKKKQQLNAKTEATLPKITPVTTESIRETPVKTEPTVIIKPTPDITMKPKAVTPKVSKKVQEAVKYQGKYEVFPEAGFFKYRLKASNGEILIVSQGYSTQKGATSGIETLKKNMATGVFSYYKDKSGFTQFNLMNENSSRVIAVGEFYDSAKSAQSAATSVKRFYMTDKIDTLARLPKDEVREELLKLGPIEQKTSGKYEVYKDEGKWHFCLKASNAEILFTSSKYASKASAISGIENVKKAIGENRFSVTKDKLGRFQFSLYASNSQLMLTGETYPVRDSAVSAVDSVRRFGLKATIIDI